LVLDVGAFVGILLGAALFGGLVSAGLILLVRSLEAKGMFARQNSRRGLLGVSRRGSEVETAWLRSTPVSATD
jgi:hypothetical protein